VFRLVTDILLNSHDRGHVQFSPPVSEALQALKRFNLERIYLNPRMKPHAGLSRDLFRRIFDGFLEDLERQRADSVIFTGYLKGMSESYLRDHPAAEIVRDYIAGMTDQYFLSFCPEHLRPGFIDEVEPIPGNLDGEDGSA
jgi:dGTPase